jgi:hypothetical protein
MSAIETLLAGLIDYAGLYPPAALDMRTAVDNYLRYRQDRHAHALGRFIVDLARIDELRGVAGPNLANLRLSVITPPDTDPRLLASLLDSGHPIQALECKLTPHGDLPNVVQNLLPGIEVYVEAPFDPSGYGVLSTIADAGARAKLRTGGLAPQAIPSPKLVAYMLTELVSRRLPFKATAGLHHPIRSRHPLTYERESLAATMHGFLNLAFAAVLLHHGGAAGEAVRILEEEDSAAWRLAPDAITCRDCRWTTEQLSGARRTFVSFGSCSFEEPIRDLEALG